VYKYSYQGKNLGKLVKGIKYNVRDGKVGIRTFVGKDAKKIVSVLGADLPVKTQPSFKKTTILTGKGWTKNLVDRTGFSPDDHKAFNRMALLHEVLEKRQVTKGTYDSLFAFRRGHASPSVLMDEHNFVMKYKGPGHEKARKAFIKMRRKSGEVDEL